MAENLVRTTADDVASAIDALDRAEAEIRNAREHLQRIIAEPATARQALRSTRIVATCADRAAHYAGAVVRRQQFDEDAEDQLKSVS